MSAVTGPAQRPREGHDAMPRLVRALLVLCTLSWWLLPGMGLIDLSVTWDPDWPVLLEAGWGLLFTVGVGVPFLIAAVRPRLARAALLQLYVVTASLLLGAVAGLEPQSWWVFVALALQTPLVRAVAGPRRLVLTRPRVALLGLAVLATPVGLPYAWEMARLNRLSLLTSDVTNGVDHYAVQATLAVALVVLPAVAAWVPAARRLLGTSTALMAAYLGMVSYSWPGTAAGFDAGWSVAVLVWAVGVLAATWWPSRTGPRQPA